MERTVLFVCLHGAAKSVLAAADCRRLAAERGLAMRAASAGTEPDPEIAPAVARALREEGAPLEGQRPRRVTRDDVAGAWRVVAFGCDLGAVAVPGVPVEQWNDIPFRRPLAKVEETVDYLRTVLAGERGAGGFKLTSPPDKPVPIVLAALRDRMLGLAARIADGAFTNFLPLSRAAQVVDAFASPEKELACRFFSIHGPEDEALAAAKRIFVAYATVPVYAEFFRWLGFGDEIDPVVKAWNAGERKRALELAPEGLVREIFLLGPVEAQREHLAEFAHAGITTAVLALSSPPNELSALIDAFAPQ